MRILHTVEFYEPVKGGAQEVVRQLSERLVARGHDVTVATTAHKGRRFSELNGVKVRGFDVKGNWARGMQGDVEGYRRFVAEGGFDVVMNYAAQQWATDALLEPLPELKAARVLVPCGFSGLGRPEYSAYFQRMPQWLKGYGACVYLSETYRDVAFARGHGLENGRLIPNGAGADEFEGPLALDIRAKLGLRADEFFVLSVGSHTGLKGHAEAIAMFEASGIENAVLVVVGNHFGPGGGPCFRACTWKAVSGNFRPTWRRRRIRMLSVDLPRPSIVAAFRSAQLFLFPSNVEASPLVLFEAAAAGLPFLCTRVGNSEEIVAWTQGGELMETHPRSDGLVEGDIADGAQKLARLWRDEPMRQRLGRAGHKAWKEHFSWEALALDYERLYQELQP